MLTKIIGDSFTAAVWVHSETTTAEIFCSAVSAWPFGICSHLSLFMSHLPYTHTLDFPLLFIIHHFSRMMSAPPDAICCRPHVNAKLNGKSKWAKWFAHDSGPLVSQRPDTLGLQRQEIGSRGNESWPCDVIYYNPLVRRGGVSLITGTSGRINSVLHDGWLQEP